MQGLHADWINLLRLGRTGHGKDFRSLSSISSGQGSAGGHLQAGRIVAGIADVLFLEYSLF